MTLHNALSCAVYLSRRTPTKYTTQQLHPAPVKPARTPTSTHKRQSWPSAHRLDLDLNVADLWLDWREGDGGGEVRGEGEEEVGDCGRGWEGTGGRHDFFKRTNNIAGCKMWGVTYWLVTIGPALHHLWWRDWDGTGERGGGE